MNFVCGNDIEIKINSLCLPQKVFDQYKNIGINSLFNWQYECIKLDGVLAGTKNLVYSAPTSAGKTLVSEIILLKRVLETKKKALFILPYVSVSREKMIYFQKLFGGIGLTVGGFMGNSSPKGGFDAVDIAVCTIEKANSLVNRMIEKDCLNCLSLIVIDELHMLGDSHRGYILELLLTKLLFQSKLLKNTDKNADSPQIVGMSATLPNLKTVSDWLSASLYICDYRPIPLLEMVKCDSKIFDCQDFSKPLRNFVAPDGVSVKDEDQVIALCLETILDGHGCLVFCPVKSRCEALSVNIASEIVRLCRIAETNNLENGFKLRNMVSVPELEQCVLNLKRCASGLDDQLEKVVPFGVAFHHAGLTNEERDIIETGYRDGHIKVLIATSTLSSGVNLPARRVIIRTPFFYRGDLIDPMTYKQMIGRAGRTGIDVKGESVLLCKLKDMEKVRTFLSRGMPAISSCLDRSDALSLKRALLEVIVPRVVRTVKDCLVYFRSTFLQHTIAASNGDNESSAASDPAANEILIECLDYLESSDLISIKSVEELNSSGVKRRGRPKKVQTLPKVELENDSRLLFPTSLGHAVLSASLGPEDGLVMFSELDKARRSLALDTDLHLIYLVSSTGFVSHFVRCLIGGMMQL